MDYSFIEIGTSDFDTLIQTATDTQRGLSIEPLAIYLNKLPDKPLVIKVNCAVSNIDGSMNIYYIKPENIRQYGLPDWVRGCNSVNKPHITVADMLKKNNINPDNVFTIDKIPVKSFPTLVKEYNIRSVRTLKIDTEGHDCIILQSYLEACQQLNTLFAKDIHFESNVLSNVEDVNNIVGQYTRHGYRVVSRNHDTHLSLDPNISNIIPELDIEYYSPMSLI